MRALVVLTMMVLPVAFAACSSNQAQAPSCVDLLSCAAGTPNFPSYLAAYGESSACWSGSEATAAQCAASCSATLDIECPGWGYDCMLNCQEYDQTCGTTSDCVAACDPADPCRGASDAYMQCFGINCSCAECAADPSDTASCNECDTLTKVTCGSELDAYVYCVASGA